MAALDMVVMNKKNQNNETKLDNMYRAVDTVVINGIGRSESELAGGECTDYSAMENFDYISYTSPLESIDNFVKDPSSTGYFAQPQNGYEPNSPFCNELIRIYTVSDDALIEMPISDLNKSNMH
jgi:hypothetical protein